MDSNGLAASARRFTRRVADFERQVTTARAPGWRAHAKPLVRWADPVARSCCLSKASHTSESVAPVTRPGLAPSPHSTKGSKRNLLAAACRSSCAPSSRDRTVFASVCRNTAAGLDASQTRRRRSIGAEMPSTLIGRRLASPPADHTINQLAQLAHVV